MLIVSLQPCPVKAIFREPGDKTVSPPVLSPPQPRQLLSTLETASEETTTSAAPAGNEDVSTRVILESNGLKDLIERNTACPKCRRPVVVTFPTSVIASACKISCSCHMCDYVDMTRPSTADVPHTEGSALRKRTTDYEINVQCVLAFLASGDGGKEAEWLLGFLGLPYLTSMEKRGWPMIESRLAAGIRELTEEILQENLSKAVSTIHHGQQELNGRSLFQQWMEGAELPVEKKPRLTVSTDMGWQKRSSGG